jgi:Spy/CpxP family protein refolding chaperone
MKRTLRFLSLLFVFTALSFAQAPQTSMGASCPMAKHGACSGEQCCKGGCDKKCCNEKSAKMCSKDKGAMRCCRKGSGKKCCSGGSSKSATQPDTGAAPKHA